MTNKTEGTITITLKEYNRLIASQTWLLYLEDAGVDNWSGIDFAYELLRDFEGDAR